MQLSPPPLRLDSCRTCVARARSHERWFDAAEIVTARLAPDPGMQVASLVTRGDHALAVIESVDHVRVRWIELAGEDWGTPSPTPRASTSSAPTVCDVAP